MLKLISTLYLQFTCVKFNAINLNIIIIKILLKGISINDQFGK